MEALHNVRAGMGMEGRGREGERERGVKKRKGE